MWALWQQIVSWFWGTGLWLGQSGHWTIVAGACFLILLFIVSRRQR
jgi:hypothetical protein